MKKLKSLLIVLIVIMLMLMPACTTQDVGQDVSTIEEIKIGVIGTMSGDQAMSGKAMTDAIELLNNEIGDNGGFILNGKEVELKFIIEDTEGKPEIAVNAVQKLIERDGVLAIIGSNNSSEVLASGEISQTAKIPQITHTGTNMKISDIGDYVFRMCYTDPYQGKLAAKLASSELNAKSVAILWNVADAYSEGVREAFISDCEKNGLNIVADESFSGLESKDYSAQLTIIKNASPDILFLPNDVNTIPLQMQQARAMGITSTFLGCDAWDYAQVPELTGGEIIDGAYYITGFSSDAETSKEFATKFEDLAGYRASFGSAMCYEAAQVVINALQNAKTLDGTGIRDAMRDTDLELPTGHVKFDENRNAVRSAVVMKYNKEIPEYYSSVNLED